MKLLRLPWIRCRADEAGAIECEILWRGCAFAVLAHTERDAKEWWSSLSDAERDELLGLSETAGGNEMTLF